MTKRSRRQIKKLYKKQIDRNFMLQRELLKALDYNTRLKKLLEDNNIEYEKDNSVEVLQGVKIPQEIYKSYSNKEKSGKLFK